MNKKGWIRIIEVFLAIMIIIGALIIIMSKNPPESRIDDSVYERQRQILELLSKNETLRSEIIQTPNTANNPIVRDFISRLASPGWEFSTNICKIDAACPNPVSILDRDVYTTERVIASNLTRYNPVKIRFFVWVKS